MTDRAEGEHVHWVYERVRGRIEHENTLILERVTWLLTSEAFLFVAYGALLLVDPAKNGAFLAQAGRLFRVIPILGLVCVVAVYGSIVAATHAIEDARGDYETRRQLRREEEDCASCRNSPLRIMTEGWIRRAGMLPAHVVPGALGGVWIYLLLFSPHVASITCS